MSQATHTHITRRSILAGLGASIPATAIIAAPAFASSNPDAELLTLGRQWEAANTAYKAQCKILSAIEERYSAIAPEVPVTLNKTENDVVLGLTLPLDKTSSPRFQPAVFNTWRGKQMRRAVSHQVTPELRQKHKLPEDAHTLTLMEPWPEKQARADEIIKAWDDWRADLARVEREVGLDEALDENERLFQIEEPIRKKIAFIPARTIEGVMLKARMSLGLWGGIEELETDLQAALEMGDVTNETMAWSVVRDLLRLSASVA